MPRTKLDLPSRFPFRTELPVRISDINYGGHLGNDAVLSILQEARLRFLSTAGYTEKEIEGVGIIMLDAVVIYRSEALYGDSLLVDVDVADIGSHGCDFVYRISRKEGGQEVVRAKTSIAFFDYSRRKIAGTPPQFAARLRGNG